MNSTLVLNVVLVSLICVAALGTTSRTEQFTGPLPPSLPSGTKWGIHISLSTNTSWSTTRDALYTLTRYGVFDAKIPYLDDNHVLPSPWNTAFIPTSTTAEGNAFLVALPTSWMLYNALGIPQALLDFYNITTITAAVSDDIPKDIAARGDHLVELEVYSWAMENASITAWRPWPHWVKTLLPRFQVYNTNDMVLINSTGTFDGDLGYISTIIASMSSFSLQIEMAGLQFHQDWGAAFPALRNTSLYPLGLSLDTLTVGYDNRVEFKFQSNKYYSFATFASNLRTVFNQEANMNVSRSSLALVDAKSTQAPHHRGGSVLVSQTFTVSFRTTNQQQKIIDISKLKDGFHYMNAESIFYNSTSVKAVPSPGPTNRPTPIPEPWGEGYILADLFTSSDCSGVAMPAAVNAGCAEGSMFMCVDEHTIIIRRFSGGGNATCDSGNHTDSIMKVGECLPTAASGGSMFMKIKGCAPLGRVPKQTGAGVCMDSFDSVACDKIHTSACYQTNQCYAIDGGTSSLKFLCDRSDGGDSDTTLIWNNPTCQGAFDEFVPPSNDNICVNSKMIRSSSSNAGAGVCGGGDKPTASTPNPDAAAPPQQAKQVAQEQEHRLAVIVVSVVGAFLVSSAIVVKLWKSKVGSEREEEEDDDGRSMTLRGDEEDHDRQQQQISPIEA